MSKVIMKGKTVDEAIESALQVLKIPKESAKIRVIDEGEPGALGVFGSREAVVEVKIKHEPEEEARIVVQEILDKMGFMTKVYVNEIIDNSINLEIKGDEIPIIIGKEGSTLDALQYLVNIIINIGLENRNFVCLDAGGYRKKQELRLERIAKEAADEAIATNKEVNLPPMNAHERRIIHMFIKNLNNVSTISRGERADRSVVIVPIK